MLARRGVGVEGVDEIAFGGDKDDIVFLAVGHGEIGDVERPSVNEAGNGAVFVDGAREEKSKGGRRESRGRERVLFEVLASTLRIVVRGICAGKIGDGDGGGGEKSGIGIAGGGERNR